MSVRQGHTCSRRPNVNAPAWVVNLSTGPSTGYEQRLAWGNSPGGQSSRAAYRIACRCAGDRNMARTSGQQRVTLLDAPIQPIEHRVVFAETEVHERERRQRNIRSLRPPVQLPMMGRDRSSSPARRVSTRWKRAHMTCRQSIRRATFRLSIASVYRFSAAYAYPRSKCPMALPGSVASTLRDSSMARSGCFAM